MMRVALVLAAMSWIGLAILLVGKRPIPALKFVEEKMARTPCRIERGDVRAEL